MSQSETLRVRVDRETARRVERWAKAHDVDVSETIRRALARLLDEDERARRVAAARQRAADAAALGLFDPPADDSWKASGGWR